LPHLKNRAFWNLQIAGWIGVLLFPQRIGAGQFAAVGLFLILILIGSITRLFRSSLVLSVVYRLLISKPVM
jgi:hypothetical protein